MLEYLLRLALLLPLLAGLIWGSLWLTRYLQTRLHGGAARQGGGRHLQLVETSLIAPGMKLAVVRFHDREILLGCTRHGLVRLSEAPAATLPESA
ncbi:flagellar biogenesis protein [Porphyrobacter sp. TH134]|uniref:flagellar biosynthetic protein FliO n=1 Tax=Porphyrobacter sp. TH134 TaxID=2067450 RepID=UPI000C7DF9DD|nr:flagellar biosynthetic protein FliO [Porphyrobacter sp. TH134]PLK23335.1 flagellar biogenesis protein [Porphyrobacter sp. TH134]